MVDEQKVIHVNNCDAEVLAGLDRKLGLLRDRLLGAVEGFSCGLLVFGTGGCGKSHTIFSTLKALRKPHQVLNSHVTAAGLVKLLKQYPSELVIVEDAEGLFDTKPALGLLRTCLEGIPGPDGRLWRKITWGTARNAESFDFCGSLVIVSNRMPPEGPEMKAIMTRVACVTIAVSDAEVAAQVRRLTEEGYSFGPHHLTRDEAREVVELVITKSRDLGEGNLNLRVTIQALRDRCQWAAGASESDWRELVISRITKKADVPVDVRANRKADELRLLKEIADLPSQEQVAAWMERTGKSRASYFRRLKEVLVSSVASS